MTVDTVTTVYTSLADRAYALLRDRLVMLDIPPGAPIHEAAVCAELEMGRTPVREALKRLATDHLVVSFARRGTFATQVDITDLGAISEMRQVLEPLAAYKAAANPRPQVRLQLGRAAADAESFSESTDPRVLLEFDLHVHRMIYRATENAHLEETLVRLGNLATRIWCLVRDRLPLVSAHIAEHAVLLGAIASGDAPLAERLAAQHVRHFEESVRACL